MSNIIVRQNRARHIIGFVVLVSSLGVILTALGLDPTPLWKAAFVVLLSQRVGPEDPPELKK